jgi:hypothetical protein
MMFFNLFTMAGAMMLGLLAMIIIAYLVSMDANSNGENGTMWFLIVLFFPMMGLLIYLIIHGMNRHAGRSGSLEYHSNVLNTTPSVPGKMKIHNSMNENRYSHTKHQDLNESQYCTNCGFQNTLEASFCKSCGVKLG